LRRPKTCRMNQGGGIFRSFRRSHAISRLDTAWRPSGRSHSSKSPICRWVPNCREYRQKAIDYADRLTARGSVGATSSFPSIDFACSAQ
jgi:hypothetical protein